MRTLRALLPGVVAICALIGCASQPPPVAVSEVRPGDAAQVIEQRGHQLLPVYQFVLDGHQYAFAKAYSEGKTYDLIFIDAKLACSSQMPIDEVTRWEWVDEPDGLDYLVGRLRQACGLEPGTAPRTLSLNEDLEHPPEIDGSQLPVPSSEVADVAKEMGAHVAAGIAIIFAWPVLVSSSPHLQCIGVAR